MRTQLNSGSGKTRNYLFHDGVLNPGLSLTNQYTINNGKIVSTFYNPNAFTLSQTIEVGKTIFVKVETLTTATNNAIVLFLDNRTIQSNFSQNNALNGTIYSGLECYTQSKSIGIQILGSAGSVGISEIWIE